MKPLGRCLCVSTLWRFAILLAAICESTGAIARSQDLPVGDAEIRRQTGDKQAIMDGTIKSTDGDTMIFRKRGGTMRIRLVEVKGIRYKDRYTEPLVGEELPIKFIRTEGSEELVRHKVAIEVGRWSIQQAVDVDQVTVSRFAGTASGGLQAVSVTSNVQRNAAIALASTTVRNTLDRPTKVWLRLLIESDTLKGHKEHEFSLSPGETEELTVGFTTAGHEVRRVITDDVFNTF